MFWLLMYELIADPFSRLNVQNSTIACWFLYARHFMLSIYLICISALLSSHAKYEYEMTRHCFYTTHDFSTQFLLTVELILKHIIFKNKVCNCLICLYSYQYGPAKKKKKSNSTFYHVLLVLCRDLELHNICHTMSLRCHKLSATPLTPYLSFDRNQAHSLGESV